MSRRVRDKYYKKLSTYWYYMGFMVELSSYNLSDSVVKIGLMTFLALCIFVFDNIHRMYFFRDRKSREDVNVAFTFRK